MTDSRDASARAIFRSIESNLRALCVDVRRRNPEVKTLAEQVILQLKEADSDEAFTKAADAAAAVFCAACAANAKSSGAPTYAAADQKAVTTAVTCLHKLVTHHAVSSASLPPILDAVERLGVASVDDNISLKVLQTNISLLSRHYTKVLSEDDLARAFALFFRLKTAATSLTAVANASTALSAISSMATGKGDGVIELTSRAAFRQVTAYLFSAASDATPDGTSSASTSGSRTSSSVALNSSPIEVRAAYRLFQDLCALLAGERLLWLANDKADSPPELAGLDNVFILEVVDDALSDNSRLFRQNGLFADLVTERLAPAIHSKIIFGPEKPVLKALLSVSATLLRGFWEELGGGCKSLLRTISDKARMQDGPGPGWTCLYSLEALRCIFASSDGPRLFACFVHAFDLSSEPSPVVSSILSVVCAGLERSQPVDFGSVPLSPMVGSSKPFGSVAANSSEVMLSIALGLFIAVGDGVRSASLAKDFEATRVFASQEISVRLVQKVADIVQGIPLPDDGLPTDQVKLWKEGMQGLLRSLTAFGTASYAADVPNCFEHSLRALSSICVSSRKEFVDASGIDACTKLTSFRLLDAHRCLLSIQESCGEGLGRNWSIILDTIAPMDEVAFGDSSSARTSADGDAFDLRHELQEALKKAFGSAGNLSWTAVHDLMSALIQSARVSIEAILSSTCEETPDAGTGRVFGIVWAEAVFASILGKAHERNGAMPEGIWLLLSGYLVSICIDCGLEQLRTSSLDALTRLASCAFACDAESFVSHKNVISPLMDLLQSPFLATRLATFESIHHLLETHGDRLVGADAWGSVLLILLAACGQEADGNGSEKKAGGSQNDGPKALAVSDGFRVVQLIADNLMPCLSREILPRWILVLGGNGRQSEDLNVALTAIGLLWRTSDLIARGERLGDSDGLWTSVFSELRDLGRDERPEVRNCAIKTLTGTLTAHAAHLSAVTWEGCISWTLLPLLENVMRDGGVVGGDEKAPARVGRKHDADFLVHHSRNTRRKQWNETKALSLTGVTSVLCIALPLLARVKRPDGTPVLLLLNDAKGGLWCQILELACTAAASLDCEVAVAGVSSLLDLLHAAGVAVSGLAKNSDLGVHGAAAVDGEEFASASSPTGAVHVTSTGLLYEAVWRAISDVVPCSEEKSAAPAGHLQVRSAKALLLLARRVSEESSQLSTELSKQRSKFLVDVLSSLVTVDEMDSVQGSAAARSTSRGLSEVNVAALNQLRMLRFGKDESSWTYLLERMLCILMRHANGGIMRRRELAGDMVAILQAFYASHDAVPAKVLNEKLLDTVVVLGRLMNERHVSIPGEATATANDVGLHSKTPLWYAATVAFQSTIQLVARIPNSSPTLWESVWKMLTVFLYSPLSGTGPEATMSPSDSQKHDILVARTVRDFLPFLSPSVPANLRQNLVGLLGRGAEKSRQSDRPDFVRACQDFVFDLADDRWVRAREGLAQNQVAGTCAALVAKMSDRILARFIADGKRAGRCPLPAERRAEVVFLLRRLRSLEAFGGEAGDRRRHLLTLYPRLAECVDVGDPAVRSFAKLLIDESAAIQVG